MAKICRICNGRKVESVCRKWPCCNCDGTGLELEKCRICNGTGLELEKRTSKLIYCPWCNGTGKNIPSCDTFAK